MAGVSGAVSAIGGLAGAYSGATGGGSSGGMPRWQKKAMKANYGYAQGVADRMSVAPQNADQRAYQRGVRQYQGYLDNDLQRVQGNIDDLANQELPELDVSKFYNPYEQDVVKAYLADLDQMRDMNELTTNDLAEKQDAFGGDRAAVYQAVSEDQLNRGAMSSIASLRHAGYDTAGQLALGDRGQWIQNRGISLAGNNDLARLIQMRRGNRGEELAMLGSSGDAQWAYDQYGRDLDQRRLGVLNAGAGAPLYNPPSQPYDRIAGAVHGFQGGYRTFQDMMRYWPGAGYGNSRASIPPSDGVGPYVG
jgi:hypothetical protein